MPCIRNSKSTRAANPSITSVRRSPRTHPVVATDPYAFLAKFERIVQKDDPLRRLYLCPDIATHFLRRLDWPTLMAFAIGSWFGTALVQHEAKTRIRDLLAPWFTSDDFASLMQLMERCSAALTGRLVRRFLQMNGEAQILARHAGFDEPENILHILVSKEHRAEFITGLKQLGYTWSERGTTRTSGPGDSAPVHTFGYMSFTRNRRRGSSIVAIDVCERGILEGVLNGRMTIDMNVITPRKIYSVFPSAVRNNESLHSDARRYGGPTNNVGEGFRVAMNNGGMDFPCGLECPGVDRVIGEDRGIGVFQWKAGDTSPYTDRLSDPVLSRNYILFRFLRNCHNSFCDNYTRSHHSRI